MKNKYSMQKMFSIFCALILLVSCFSVLSACQPKHTCQSVCQDCGKCTNANCVEKACAVKCLEHHVCESLCPTCNKCTDTDCVEAVCANKCQGHHTCTSQCEKCGKCLNRNCQESACQQKCPRDHHECRTTCDNCGKCMDYFCPQPECVTKCACPHTCESVCPTCNKCTDIYCKNPICQQKCDQAPMIGHNFTYTGPITASESAVMVTTFTTSTKMTYLYQLVDESSMRASSVSDYPIEDYVANGIPVKYIFDMVVVQYKDLDGQEESDIHLERHPCNIANLPWTNVVYVYLKGELVMEIYYCSPYELSITCFLQLIPRYLQKFYA